MFVVLDTNHFRELREDTAAGRTLQRRIEEREADVFTCIVAVEETIEGWFALIKRHAAGRDQITAYARLHRSIEALSNSRSCPSMTQRRTHFTASAMRVFASARWT